MSGNTNYKISNLVNSQVPFFVRNDHPTFIKFLEAYYKYTEQSGGVVERAKNLRSNIDIDASSEDFKSFIYSQYMKQIPDNVVVDRDIILKNIKELYLARGTEKATKFMLNILFGINADNISFYYPKRDILRASDGKWYVKKTLKISDYTIDGVANTDVSGLNYFVNKQIRGAKSNAVAIVEKVESYLEKGFLVTELEISNQKRNFAFNESISTNFVDPVTGATRIISANMYSGFVSQVNLIKGGLGYEEGTIVPVESNTGTGAIIRIDQVTLGGINAVIMNTSAFAAAGAGFQVNNNIVISPVSGKGGGAEAVVTGVRDDNVYHPNTYLIPISTISRVANIALNEAVYSNLNNSNINTTLANATSYFVYGNTGPFLSASVTIPGARYTIPPTADIVANSRIQSLGILGRMEIVDGGLNYAVNDRIEFDNIDGGMGTGAAANVTSVAANGMIQEVKFVEVPGHTVGGSGYSQRYLPTARIVSATGSGANIVATAVLGDGEVLKTITEDIGKILKLSIINSGTGYATPPTINLKGFGSGTAQATSNIMTGIYYYQGRYINDDGHLSSYNFLEDKDYYQNFSYVIRSEASFASYEKTLKDLLHPAGIKMFGEYMLTDNTSLGEHTITNEDTTKTIIYNNQNYNMSLGNNITVTLNDTSDLNVGSKIFIEFQSGNAANMQANINEVDGYFTVSNVISSNIVSVYSGRFLPGSIDIDPTVSIAALALYLDPSDRYIFTNSGSSTLRRYTMNVAGDITTANLTPKTKQIDGFIQGIEFNKDGTKLYTAGTPGHLIYQYNVTDSWNISTASLVTTYNISSQDTAIRGVSLSEDGKYVYILGYRTNTVYQYVMSESWNVNTSSLLTSYNLRSQFLNAQGMQFKPDGKSMYVVGNADYKIYQYDLPVAWNVNTAIINTNSISFSSLDPSILDLRIRSDGKMLYLSGRTANTIIQVPMTEAWNINTAIYYAGTGVANVGKTII